MKPFDRKAAEAGEPICWEDGDPCTFVAADARLACVRCPGQDGWLYIRGYHYFRMAPETVKIDVRLYRSVRHGQYLLSSLDGDLGDEQAVSDVQTIEFEVTE